MSDGAIVEELRHLSDRVASVERLLRGQGERADILSRRLANAEQLAQEAKRMADQAHHSGEQLTHAVISHVATIEGRLKRQDVELATQTTSLDRLLESDRARTKREEIAIAIDSDRRSSLEQRERRIDRLLKWWPVAAALLVPIVGWVLTWLVSLAHLRP